MKKLPRIATLLGCVALSAMTMAGEMVTEVVPVSYRTVEEVLSIVRPLVPSPGSVSGIYGKLVIRTTPDNLAEIKSILATVDRAPKTLMITVRHSISKDIRQLEQGAYGSVEKGNVSLSAGSPHGPRHGAVLSHQGEDHRADVRVLSTRRSTQEGDEQRIRVLEGREAFVQTGTSVPLAQRNVYVTGTGATVQDTIAYKDVTTGFYVVPRLTGDGHVILDISPHRSRLSRSGGGAIDVQRSHTNMSARLGEWVEIGGVDQSEYRTDSGTLYRNQTRGATDRSIFLKVDELPR